MLAVKRLECAEQLNEKITCQTARTCKVVDPGILVHVSQKFTPGKHHLKLASFIESYSIAGSNEVMMVNTEEMVTVHCRLDCI